MHCEVGMHTVYQRLYHKMLAEVHPNTFLFILHACSYQVFTDYELETKVEFIQQCGAPSSNFIMMPGLSFKRV